MKLRIQTLALAAIGIADLVTTLLFVGLANAAEANPLMAPILERGPVAFIQAKLLLLIVPIAVLEFARRRIPFFVHRAVNTAIVLYVGLYVLGVSHVNGAAARRVTSLPHSTQAHLDARRLQLGLPLAPPLSMLQRAEEQRRMVKAAAETKDASDLVAARESVRALGLIGTVSGIM